MHPRSGSRYSPELLIARLSQTGRAVETAPQPTHGQIGLAAEDEQALVSLRLKKTFDAEVC